MTSETEELLNDLRAVYGEIFPYRDPRRCDPTDAELAGLVLLRREILLRLPIKLVSPGWAEGSEPGVTAKPRRKK